MVASVVCGLQQHAARYSLVASSTMLAAMAALGWQSTTGQMMRTRAGTSRPIARPWTAERQKAGQRVANSARAVAHPCVPRRTSKTFRGRLVCSSTECALPAPDAQRCTASMQRDMQHPRPRVARRPPPAQQPMGRGWRLDSSGRGDAHVHDIEAWTWTWTLLEHRDHR
jgi:hypothetical protein